MFVFYDGNKIGDIFKDHILKNDVSGLQDLSLRLSLIHAAIKAACQILGGKILEAGGDEGLLECADHLKVIEIIESSWSKQNLSVSIGTGDTPSEAFIACLTFKDQKNVEMG